MNIITEGFCDALKWSLNNIGTVMLVDTSQSERGNVVFSVHGDSDALCMVKMSNDNTHEDLSNGYLSRCLDCVANNKLLSPFVLGFQSGNIKFLYNQQS